MVAKAPRSRRVDALARRYARLCATIYAKNPASKKARSGKKPLRRRETNARPKPMVAYDLETTRIKEGTPDPLYLTWFGEGTQGSVKIDSLKHLGDVLAARVLIPEFNRFRFVAWNGNKFDVYLIAAALLENPNYVLRPYLTRSKNLRGMRVTETVTDPGKKPLSWEFLDGMAMTGANSWPDGRLKFFLERFAPEYAKLSGPDFESGEEFDSSNPEHVRYAERDSEGLYHAMQHAQGIVKDTFGVPLYPTIGNTGIRIFTRNIPQGVTIWEPPASALEVIRNFVMRGGYCVNVRKYQGAIWKYDINQAYAAAMRETWLPAGRCIHTDRVSRYANAAIYRVRACKPSNRVPFYFRDSDQKAVYGLHELTDTWITNEELSQLQNENWDVSVSEGWIWDEVFNMREYVDRLEALRGSAAGGPSGAIGLMIKAVGNNSYGKTVEKLDGLELVLSKDCPEGFAAYQDDADLFQHVWFKIAAPVPREYHQPQLGSFITAHVRMVMRRAILLDVDAWLYADTDGLKFFRPVPGLPLDAKKYGLWKLEVEGKPHYVLNKKTYASLETISEMVNGVEILRPKSAHAKGLNVKKLTAEDYRKWFEEGKAPVQEQLQRQNFVKVMTGFDMFATRKKAGESSNRKNTNLYS